MNRIVISSWADNYTGYGQHCAQIVRYLLRRGIEVVVRPVKYSEKFIEVDPEVTSRMRFDVQGEPLELLLSPPVVTPTGGKRTVYFTMWETSLIKEAHARALNMASRVVVPCQWNLESFRKSGVKVPIYMVPLGIDPEVYYPKTMNMKGPCIFGCAGRLAHGQIRKGVIDVIKMFQLAFPSEPDVRLRVKAFDDDSLPERTDPRIEVTRRFLLESELAEWMRGLTAFVSFARGEGWGLMQHQALACGRPLIAPIYGGLREFATEANTYPVAYREVNPDDPNTYFQTGKWCLYDPNSAVEAMRAVHRDRQQAQAKGMTGASDALNFTWEKSCDALLPLLV